jgi:chitinase
LIGDKVNVNGNIYICIEPHKSQIIYSPNNYWQLTAHTGPCVPVVTPVPSVPVVTPVPSVPVVTPVPSVPVVTPVPSWTNNTSYIINNQVTHNGNMYKCITPHTAQSDWSPSTATASLWQLISGSSGVPSVPVVTPVPSVPVVTPVTPVPSVPVVTPVTPVPVINSRSLTKLLNGQPPIGVYFQAWSSGWSSSGASLDLARIELPINIVYLSFVRPETTYTSGRNSLSGTGLDFSSDFNVVRDAIKILRNKGIIVMLSVGGATYPFTTYNASNVAQLTKDLGCNGIDIDWENHETKSEFGSYIQKTRDALGPDYPVSTAAFSVGAYGEGAFANAPPASDYTGMNIAGLKSNGNQLDWINIMSYDAGNSYSSTQAFDAYRSFYSGPLLIGFEIPPEAWGGHVLTLDKVKVHSEYVRNAGPQHGMFIWSYQKQGSPSCSEIVNASFNILKNQITSSIPSVPITPIPTTPIVPVTPVVVPSNTSTSSKQTTTWLAPYIYSWGIGNPVYKIDSLKTAMSKINLKYASYAFVISDGRSNLNITQDNINDMKAFVDAGNTLIISCGGANGPFIQDSMTLPQIVSALSGLLDKTGSRHLDFDIEGGSVENVSSYTLLNQSILQLQQKYTGLYVSYTLPIGSPQWDGFAIQQSGINIINNAKNMGININVVNGMIMNVSANTVWSTMSISMCEAMHQQLSKIYPNKSIPEIYKMIGATFMCFREDTGGIFSVSDAQILALYAKQKGLGMVSYWSIQRDQIGTGPLAIYSQGNTVDFEFYNAINAIIN